MSTKYVSTAGLLLFAALSICNTGCTFPLNTIAAHPNFMVPWPIPVSPYFQKIEEDKKWNAERYERVPILGPVTSGGPCVALDPPSQDEVMRAMEKARGVQGGIPLLWEKQRNNVHMVIEPIADYIDPPRVYPLIGPAQQHHAHYKCTVYFSETTHVGWPIPYTHTDEDSREVIYIDHNHFHMVGNVDEPGALSVY